jgi:two-component system KDP operon response regulator KdpE
LPTTEEGGIKSLKLQNLEINFATRRVISKGREVRLTPKEFDLLHYLVANPNVPIPHGKLLQAVWGPDYGDEVEYLRVFVNQLRKKLEPDPSNPQFLLTEPWVGYRFRLAD